MSIRFWSRFIAITWVLSIGTVAYYSWSPRVEFPIDFWQADKVYHVLAYGWLALLPMIGYEKKHYALVASLSMILLGILLEVGQLYAPGRHFSTVDVIANTVGVIVGFYFGNYLRNRTVMLRRIYAEL